MEDNHDSRILDALNVLRNIFGEVCQSYKAEILSVLEVLVNDSAVVARGHGDLSPQLAPQSVRDLMERLNKKSTQIKKYLSRSEEEATGSEPIWKNEDPRVVDLQIGEKTANLAIKFRKGLSQRSLATEFDTWELNTYGSLRISGLVAEVPQARKCGHITAFLKAKPQFKDLTAIRTGIYHGIKLLVLERLFGRSTVSAVLLFVSRQFQRVKHEELTSLKMLLGSSKLITELVEGRAGWFDNCQKYYDST